MALRERLSGSAALAFGAMLLASAASAECRTSPISAKGEPQRDIGAATQSAYDALAAAIKAKLGSQWTPGSRRGAEYTCVKPMGGPVGRLSWTCTLKSFPCRP